KNIIQVSNEAVRALLLYDCPGNIGQLRSDIQVSCARSFLNHMVAQTKMMKIGMDELPPAAKKGLLRIQTNRFETEKLIGNNDLIVHPKVIQDKVFPNEDVYTFPNEIYHYIENRYLDLQTQDMSQEVINHIIGSEMEERLEKLMKRVEDNIKPLEKKDLIKIVGIEVIHAVEKIIKVAKSRLGINVENLYYVLAVHLSTTIDRLKRGKIVKHPQLDKIQREYKKEYAVAKEMVNTIEEELDIVLTDDEAGFITMYLRMMTKEKETDEEGKIGVVVLSHGNVASAMADVANRLLGVIHAKFVEMSLDESPKSALNRAIDVSKSADEGKGVLLLVDMGSLITFGELITEKTGIKTRSLNKTNTIMVIEAVRRSILPDADLNEIADTLEEKSKYISRLVNTDEKIQNESKKNRVIIAICITGQGSAQKIKELLEDVIIGYKEDVKILLIGALAPNIKENILDIQRKNDVITIVGTVNPNVSNIPFISLEDIVKGDGVSRLKNLMKHSDTKVTDEEKYIQKFKLLDLTHSSLSLLDMDSNSKEEAIFRLSRLLIENKYVKEGFVYSVLEREEIGPTFLSKKVTIPHADPSYVLKPGIALGKLRKEIEWNGRKIKFIIMLALTSDCINVVEEIYDFFEAENNVEKIIEKDQFEDIMDTLRIYQGR
ncbi:MAG: PTS sugar transporter subunit IIA, partial [Clostridia bacterium]|nr:PTS sugar transporter subunit IIA [Clostridia bacterium]